MNAHAEHLESFIHHCMTPRPGLHGKKTILAAQADWKPEEAIGPSPRPLAASLFRELITRRVWSIAREQMGYTALPPVELMLSIEGKPYIDVRASFNSLLPAGLPDEMCGTLVNAWLARLDAHPELRGTIESDVVHTVAVPFLKEQIATRYPGLLSEDELEVYDCALTVLTQNALHPQGGLYVGLAKIDRLHSLQEKQGLNTPGALAGLNVLDLGLAISTTFEECLALGTLPFVSIAHHALIAENILQALVSAGALSAVRLTHFKEGIHTIHDDLAADLSRVCSGALEKEEFLHKYGHVRENAYDILSPSYAEQANLFQTLAPVSIVNSVAPFILSQQETQAIEALLHAQGLLLSAEDLLAYSRDAVAGKAYARFTFTRHISRLLTLLGAWGERLGLTLEDLAMLPIGDVLDAMTMPLHKESLHTLRERIRHNREERELMPVAHMADIIRAPQDIYRGTAPCHAN